MFNFLELPKVDAHVHINHSNPEVIRYGLRNNMKYLSINVDVEDYPSVAEQEEVIISLRKEFGDSVNWAATFESAGWGKNNWTRNTIDKISRSLDKGASGVKIWKNFGMSLKDKNGKYVMADHPSLDPVYDFISSTGTTLLGHIGEPKNCWLPLKEMTVSSDRHYFSKYPEYHMYQRSDMPSYQEQLDARDHILSKHPTLKFVGLHLSSQEWSVAEIGKFLDQFPNSMVDLAERICHLQYQAVTDHEKVRRFLVDYQDRIIYGTDMQYFQWFTEERLFKEMDQRYSMHWDFLAGNQTMTAPKVTGRFRGMGLSEEILRKIYHTNASKVYRGI